MKRLISIIACILFLGGCQRHQADILLGFRPSSISVTQESQIKGEVIFTETIGEDSYAHIKLSKAIEVNVKIQETLKLRPGDLVCLTIDPTRMYFFDYSGIRVSGV